MSAEATPEELLDRWHKCAPVAALAEDVKRMLIEGYGAYEIQLDMMSAEDFKNDEEIREGLLDSLYTITLPRALSRIYDEEALALQSMEEIDDPQLLAEMRDAGMSVEATNDPWREIFDDLDGEPGDTLSYRLLITQHSIGQRTSIALEREGPYVTGFKVYGHSQPLIDRMISVVGFPEYEGAPGNGGLGKRGDLQDDDFVYYLRILERTGTI